MSFYLTKTHPDTSRHLTKFLFVLIFLIVAAYFLFLRKDYESIVLASNVRQIKGTLVNQLVIQQTKGGYPWIDITLKEQPGSSFQIGNKDFYALKGRKLVEEVKAGDSLRISISKEDYTKVMSDGKKVTGVQVYSLQTSSKTYLTIEDVNTNRKETQFSWLWVIVPVLAIGLFYFILDSSGQLERFSRWWAQLQASR